MRINIPSRDIERQRWLAMHTPTLERHSTVDYGHDLQFVFSGAPTEPRLRLLIDEVAPMVRDRVASARAGR